MHDLIPFRLKTIDPNLLKNKSARENFNQKFQAAMMKIFLGKENEVSDSDKKFIARTLLGKKPTDVLTPDEKDKVFADIKQVIDIKGKNTFGEDSFDRDPYKAALPGQEIDKVDNFIQEIEGAVRRLEMVFGDDIAQSLLTPSLKRLKALIRKDVPDDGMNMATPMNRAEMAEGMDTFEKALMSEIRDRQLGVNEHDVAEWNDRSNDELEFLAEGMRADGAPAAIIAAKETSEVAKSQRSSTNNDGEVEFDFTRKQSAEKWLEQINDTISKLPDTVAHDLEMLKRKISKLEKLTDDDLTAIENVLKLDDVVVTEDLKNEFKESFNAMIENTTEGVVDGFIKPDSLDLTKNQQLEMKAIAEIRKQGVPAAFTAEHNKKLMVKASKLLNSGHSYRSQVDSIKKAEEIFGLTDNAEFQAMSSEDKKAFLSAKIDASFKSEQSENVPEYITRDPEEFYTEFQDNIRHLHQFVNNIKRYDQQSLEDDEVRKALEKDLVNYVSNGTVSKELKAALEANDDAQNALDYFKAGTGNVRMNVGFMKAMFTMPRKVNGRLKQVINFPNMVKESNSMEELANNLHVAIITSKANGRDLEVPEELLAGDDTKDMYVFNPTAFYEDPPTIVTDEKGNKTQQRTYTYQLVRELEATEIVGKDGKGGLKLTTKGKAAKDYTPSELFESLEKANSQLAKLMLTLHNDDKTKVGEEIKKWITNGALMDPAAKENEQLADDDGKKDKPIVLRFASQELLAGIIKHDTQDFLERYEESKGYEITENDDGEKVAPESSFAQMARAKEKLHEQMKKLGVFKKTVILDGYAENELQEGLNNFALVMQNVSEGLKTATDRAEDKDEALYKEFDGEEVYQNAALGLGNKDDEKVVAAGPDRSGSTAYNLDAALQQYADAHHTGNRLLAALNMFDADYGGYEEDKPIDIFKNQKGQYGLSKTDELFLENIRGSYLQAMG